MRYCKECMVINLHSLLIQIEVTAGTDIIEKKSVPCDLKNSTVLWYKSSNA